MSCKNKCEEFKAKKPLAKIRRYSLGQKYCNTCMIFLEWDGLYCPCCHYRLRESPRNSKVKQAYRREHKNVQ